MKKYALVLCLALAAGIARGDEMTPEKANRYGRAYGAVLGFIKSMDYMSTSCGGDAKDLTVVWERRNAQQKTQAETLFGKVIAQVEKEAGKKAADDTRAQMRQQLEQLQAEAAKKSFAQLASSPPDQKAFVCGKFVASVQAGEWDIERKNPRLYQFLAAESL